MKKRLISVILAAAMFTMAGCGGNDNASSNAGTTAANKEVIVEKTKDEKNSSNQTSLIANKEDKGMKSALITYDADKVRISDVVGKDGMPVRK